ncbi:MAG: DUF1684 domain-containing protein [Acidimicrobiia bacterium]
MSTANRPGTPLEDPRASLSLLDYRRRVADIYREVRGLEAAAGHALWLERRNDLFSTHPQSPVPPEQRGSFSGLKVFSYDPALRVEAAVTPTTPSRLEIPHSGEGTTPARAFGSVEFEVGGMACRLTLYWLDEYGGGVFLPLRDATSGTETYGSGRYLLDGAKGADLGSDATSIVLDFNFAYHPSCVYDARWSCPLAPPQNRLDAAIRGGEHL